MKRGYGTRVSGALVAAVLVVSLAGCGDGQANGNEGRGALHAVSGESASRATLGRAYIGKPRPPVKVLLAGEPALAAGVPGELLLEVHAGLPVSGLHLDMEGEGNLVVTGVERLEGGPGVRGPQAATLSRGVAGEYRVLATPLSGGSSSLSGQVRFMVGNVEQAAPFRVSLNVQGAPGVSPRMEKAEAPAVVDSTGEAVVAMPATTRVAEGKHQ